MIRFHRRDALGKPALLIASVLLLAIALVACSGDATTTPASPVPTVAATATPGPVAPLTAEVSATPTPTPPPPPPPPAEPTLSDTGLITMDIEVGTGAVAEVGDLVEVHYTGRLVDDTIFDSSVGGAPLPFRLGDGRVIEGWEEGIAGMKVGGRRLLIIPPELAYGAEGFPGYIPPNATLSFEVELMSVTQP